MSGFKPMVLIPIPSQRLIIPIQTSPAVGKLPHIGDDLTGWGTKKVNKKKQNRESSA